MRVSSGAWAAKTPLERKGGLDEAVGAYGGDYLPGLSADWVLEAREEHRAGPPDWRGQPRAHAAWRMGKPHRSSFRAAI